MVSIIATIISAGFILDNPILYKSKMDREKHIFENNNKSYFKFGNVMKKGNEVSLQYFSNNTLYN
jgi:hypothetical protein